MGTDVASRILRKHAIPIKLYFRKLVAVSLQWNKGVISKTNVKVGFNWFCIIIRIPFTITLLLDAWSGYTLQDVTKSNSAAEIELKRGARYEGIVVVGLRLKAVIWYPVTS